MSAQNQQGIASNSDISIVTNIFNIINISIGTDNSNPVRVRTVTTSTTTISRTAQPAPTQPTADAPDGPGDDAPDSSAHGDNDHEGHYEDDEEDDIDFSQLPSSPPSARCPDSDDSQVRYGELEDEMAGGRLTLPQKKKEKEKQDPKAPKPPVRWPKDLKKSGDEQVGPEEDPEKGAGQLEKGGKPEAGQDDGDAGVDSEEAELPE